MSVKIKQAGAELGQAQVKVRLSLRWKWKSDEETKTKSTDEYLMKNGIRMNKLTSAGLKLWLLFYTSGSEIDGWWSVVSGWIRNNNVKLNPTENWS